MKYAYTLILLAFISLGEARRAHKSLSSSSTSSHRSRTRNLLPETDAIVVLYDKEYKIKIKEDIETDTGLETTGIHIYWQINDANGKSVSDEDKNIFFKGIRRLAEEDLHSNEKTNQALELLLPVKNSDNLHVSYLDLPRPMVTFIREKGSDEEVINLDFAFNSHLQISIKEWGHEIVMRYINDHQEPVFNKAMGILSRIVQFSPNGADRYDTMAQKDPITIESIKSALMELAQLASSKKIAKINELLRASADTTSVSLLIGDVKKIFPEVANRLIKNQ